METPTVGGGRLGAALSRSDCRSGAKSELETLEAQARLHLCNRCPWTVPQLQHHVAEREAERIAVAARPRRGMPFGKSP